MNSTHNDIQFLLRITDHLVDFHRSGSILLNFSEKRKNGMMMSYCVLKSFLFLMMSSDDYMYFSSLSLSQNKIL